MPSVKLWLLTATGNFEEGGGGEGGEWGGEEKQQYKQQLQASTKLNHKLQQMADYQPGDRLKEGTQIFILLSVQPKVNHEIFFHLLDLTELNSWILLSSCGAKCTHRDFRLLLVRNLNEEAGKSQDRLTPRLVGRPSAAATNVLRLEGRHNKHWPAKSSTHLWCCLCSSHGQRKRTVYKCTRCDMGLCVVPCFEEYQTKVNFLITLVVNNVCHDKTVILGATDLLQQPELCE